MWLDTTIHLRGRRIDRLRAGPGWWMRPARTCLRVEWLASPPHRELPSASPARRGRLSTRAHLRRCGSDDPSRQALRESDLDPLLRISSSASTFPKGRAFSVIRCSARTHSGSPLLATRILRAMNPSANLSGARHSAPRIRAKPRNVSASNQSLERCEPQHCSSKLSLRSKISADTAT